MPGALTVQIKGQKQLAKLMKKAPKIAKEEIRKAVSDSVMLVLRTAKGEVPVDTGRLRNSILPNLKDPFTGSVDALTEYALIVEEGHSGIQAKTKKILAVRAAKAGARLKSRRKPRKGWIIIGKRVPPKKANPFMARTRKKTENKVERRFRLATENIVAKLSA